MGVRRTVLSCLFVLLVGCGSQVAESIASVEAPDDASQSDGSAGSGAGSDSTASTDGSGTNPPATTTTAQSSETTSTTTGASTALTSMPETSTSQPDGDPAGSVIERDVDGAFTSPSGNIACLMHEASGVTCWISAKDWNIEQPDGPFCAESDWGNAIDLYATGVAWPCYTDFIWDPTADPLPYGSAMVVDQYRCDSARSGVTCFNQAGDGFNLARAAYQIL